jgi:gluconate 2-dehydrogenase gamma chain
MPSQFPRRTLLQSVAAVAAGVGRMSAQDASHVHQHTAQAASKTGGAYQPHLLTAHEYKTVRQLADLIIPPDTGEPGGAGAGAAEFIDLLAANNEKLKDVWLSGLGWLDHEARRRGGPSFVDAAPEVRKQILDEISFRKNSTPELAPGIRFFEWARRMVVDAYFTSTAGVKALGFQGNTGMAEFKVPRESLDYALARSPFKQL